MRRCLKFLARCDNVVFGPFFERLPAVPYSSQARCCSGPRPAQLLPFIDRREHRISVKPVATRTPRFQSVIDDVSFLSEENETKNRTEFRKLISERADEKRLNCKLMTEAGKFDRLSTKFFSNFFQTSIAKLLRENGSTRSSLFCRRCFNGELTVRTFDSSDQSWSCERGEKALPSLPSIARVVATLIQTTRSPRVLFTIDGPAATAPAPPFFEVGVYLAPYFQTLWGVPLSLKIFLLARLRVWSEFIRISISGKRVRHVCRNICAFVE